MQQSYDLSLSRRIRDTPYTHRVRAAGVKSYTVYNHMLLATAFDSIVDDYHHLKNHVQVWDVRPQHQVQTLSKRRQNGDAVHFCVAAMVT